MFTAFLYEHADDNFRIAARRITNKPGIVFELFLLPKLLTGGVTDDLRCSRFASDIDSGEPDVARSATFFVYDAVHGIGNLLDRRFGKRKPLFTNIRGVLQQMRLFENAAHGDPANGVCELQGSGDNGALTDGHRNGFTGIPFAMIDALDPFCRRHQPWQLLGEINSGLASQTQFTAVVG